MQVYMPTIGTKFQRCPFTFSEAPEIFPMLVDSTDFAVYPVNRSVLRDRLPRVQHLMASLYDRDCSNEPYGLRPHILAELT